MDAVLRQLQGYVPVHSSTTSLRRKENHRLVAMHANYHTDKAHKMKLVYQYYTNGAGIDVLNCDVGCGQKT